jgi:hypothetical protein
VLVLQRSRKLQICRCEVADRVDADHGVRKPRSRPSPRCVLELASSNPIVPDLLFGAFSASGRACPSSHALHPYVPNNPSSFSGRIWNAREEGGKGYYVEGRYGVGIWHRTELGIYHCDLPVAFDRTCTSTSVLVTEKHATSNPTATLCI